MTWMEILAYTVEVVLGLVATVVIPYLASALKNKTNQQRLVRYMDVAEKLVTDSVLMVKQTFVDSLKAEGKFDVDAQKRAFDMCKDNWLNMVNDEVKRVVVTEIGDVEKWLQTKIEAEINVDKSISGSSGALSIAS